MRRHRIELRARLPQQALSGFAGPFVQRRRDNHAPGSISTGDAAAVGGGAATTACAGGATAAGPVT